MDKNILDICWKKRNGQIIASWDDIAEEYGYADGEKLRLLFKSHRRKMDRESVSPVESIITQAVETLNELDVKKEIIKLRDQRRELNKVVMQSARFEYFKDEVVRVFKEENKVNPIIVKPQVCTFQDNNEMLALWADWHYSMFCDNHWNQYSTEVFKERFDKLINETISIGKFHGVNTVTVMALGDLLSGAIHVSVRVASTEDIIEQTKDVAKYIVDGLKTLANNFELVNFHTVIGNHSRVVANKHDALENENFENLIHWYVESRFEDVPNVIIHNNTKDKTVAMANINGHLVYGVHGDLDRLSNVVQNLSLMFKEIPYMICMGHLHHHQEDTVQGVKVLMTGSLVGTDEYAKNIRKVGSPSQAVVIFDEKGKRCVYDVEL